MIQNLEPYAQNDQNVPEWPKTSNPMPKMTQKNSPITVDLNPKTTDAIGLNLRI